VFLLYVARHKVQNQNIKHFKNALNFDYLKTYLRATFKDVIYPDFRFCVVWAHICKIANKDQGFVECNKQAIISMYIVMYLQFDNKILNVTGSLALGRKV